MHNYKVTHFMFLSKVCQLLCDLHSITTEMPKGPEVNQREELNLSVNQITAHIQCRDMCIHWRDSSIGQVTLCLIVPEDNLYNLNTLYGLEHWSVQDHIK